MPVLQWHPGKGHAAFGDGLAPVLQADGGSHAFFLYVKDDPLGLPIAVVNDILRMKAVTPAGAVLDNWLLVTGRDTTPTGYTIYTVVKQSGTAGLFPAGTAVVNYGQSGQGFLFLTSDDSDGPFYSVRTHAGAPWSVQTEVGRFGNLKNSFGVGANNRYGFAAGDYAGGNYLLYNPTDGFVLKAGGGADVIDANGITIIAGAAEDNVKAYRISDGTNLLGKFWGLFSGALTETDLVGLATSAKNNTLNINAARSGTKTATLDLTAGNNIDVQANIHMVADTAGSTPTINITASTITISGTTSISGNGTVTGGLNVGTATGAGTGSVSASTGLNLGTVSSGAGQGQIIANDNQVAGKRTGSLASGGTITLGNFRGLILVSNATDNTCELFIVKSGGTITVVSDQGMTASLTDAGVTMAVYWDGGTSNWTVKNRFAVAKDIRVQVFGN